MKRNMQGGRAENVSGTLRRQGVTGLLLQMWTARSAAGACHVRKMQLLETLSLGGKRQLALIQCGDEQFLVGGGLETVETIVKVNSVADGLRREQGGVCR
jgi:flagellar biogenesis protein FliO